MEYRKIPRYQKYSDTHETRFGTFLKTVSDTAHVLVLCSFVARLIDWVIDGEKETP